MSEFVITDDFVRGSIVNRGHRVPLGVKLGKFAFSSSDFVFGQRNTLQAFAHRLLDRIGDTLAGAFGQSSDQLVGFLILDQNGHIGLRIYSSEKIYIEAITITTTLILLTFPVPPHASRCRGGRILPASGCGRSPRRRAPVPRARSCRWPRR